MKMEPYYSQRQGQPVIRDQEIGQRFWDAFTGYIREIEQKDYFAEFFPVQCPDGNGICSWSLRLLKSRLLGELPFGEWPLPSDLPIKEAVFDFIEFFYRVISIPFGSYHEYFRHYDYSGFNKDDAQKEYAARINQYLQTCRHPYDFTDGQIKSSISPVLDYSFKEEEFKLEDEHLLGLLHSSIEDFFDKSGSKKHKALESLVDAYERLKTVESRDKRASIEKTISKISTIDAVKQTLNDDMRILTEIANEFTIRHHEMTKRQLDDEDLIEYLFYAYYNVIRLILKKYNGIKKK
jgi:hypothetical protein